MLPVEGLSYFREIGRCNIAREKTTTTSWEIVISNCEETSLRPGTKTLGGRKTEEERRVISAQGAKRDRFGEKKSIVFQLDEEHSRCSRSPEKNAALRTGWGGGRLRQFVTDICSFFA